MSHEIRDYYWDQFFHLLEQGRIPPYVLAIQRGLVPGSRRQVVFGHNPDIDAGQSEDIWEQGGLYPFQSSSQSLEILSSDSNDTSSGSGVQSVIVFGLDGDYIEQSETIEMNGVTPVPLSKSYLRINSIEARGPNTNIGAVTLRVAGGGDVQALMAAGDGLSMQAIFTVPAGKTAFFHSREGAILQASSGGSAEIHVKVRNIAANIPWISRSIYGVQSDGTSSLIKALPFLRVPEKSDFRVTTVSVSGNNTNLSVTLETFLIDD